MKHFSDHHQFWTQSFKCREDIQRSNVPKTQIERKKNSRCTKTFFRIHKSKNKRNEIEKQRKNIQTIPKDREIREQTSNNTRQINRKDLNKDLSKREKERRRGILTCRISSMKRVKIQKVRIHSEFDGDERDSNPYFLDSLNIDRRQLSSVPIKH